jgi:hypothetical protein
VKEVLIALISAILGSGGVGLLTLFLNNTKTKREENKKETDDRILGWQAISDKYEDERRALKRELEEERQNRRAEQAQLQQAIRSLELYTRELTIIMARAVPPLDIPPYPQLGINLEQRAEGNE